MVSTSSPLPPAWVQRLPLEAFFSNASSQIKPIPALIGVSGGVDSMVLLDILHRYYPTIALRVCHVNHQLRGEDSDKDAMLVKKIAEQYKLPFIKKAGAVATMAQEEKKSLELAARDFRYQCFSQIAQETDIHQLFLAHHAHDQAETLLLNLCRGSSGLKGIPATHQRDNIILHRPFLSITRKEILDYAYRHNIAWREDKTNAELDANRNKIRHLVIPLLEQISQRDIVKKWAHAAQLESEKTHALNAAIEQLNLLDPQGRLFLPKVTTLSRTLQQAIIHWYLHRALIHNITRELIEQALSLIIQKNIAKICLPNGKYLRRKEQRLFIE